MNNSKDTNEKQNLKSQRVRSSPTGCKDIILKKVFRMSPFEIADSAGYTFSTIYNYWKPERAAAG